MSLAVARENTLHSLNSAAQRGADYVEFDVHLTKDKIPIIFHDFHVLVSVAKRSSPDCLTAISNSKTGAVEEHELAVKDLKFSQLRLLHVSLESLFYSLIFSWIMLNTNDEVVRRMPKTSSITKSLEHTMKQMNIDRFQHLREPSIMFPKKLVSISRSNFPCSG